MTKHVLKGDSKPNDSMFYQKELYEYHQNRMKNGEVIDI